MSAHVDIMIWLLYSTYINVDNAYNEIVHANFGEAGIKRLAQGRNAVPPVRLEPVIPLSQLSQLLQASRFWYIHLYRIDGQRGFVRACATSLARTFAARTNNGVARMGVQNNL